MNLSPDSIFDEDMDTLDNEVRVFNNNNNNNKYNNNNIPSLLKIDFNGITNVTGDNMTSINAIMPSNIRITQRSNNNNNNNVLSKIIQDNKDSITAKSTTTFIIQNKKLELLKQQDASSSAFESTTITPTPESKPKRKDNTPDSEIVRKTTFGKALTYTTTKDPHNVIKHTNHFIGMQKLMPQLKRETTKIMKTDKTTSLLRITSLKNNKTSFVIDPSNMRSKNDHNDNNSNNHGYDSEDHNDAFRRNNLASPINVPPPPSSSATSSNTRKRKAAVKSRSIYHPSPERNSNRNGISRRRRPVVGKNLFDLVNGIDNNNIKINKNDEDTVGGKSSQKNTFETNNNNNNNNNADSNSTDYNNIRIKNESIRKVRLIMSPVHFDEKGVHFDEKGMFNPRLSNQYATIGSSSSSNMMATSPTSNKSNNSNSNVKDNVSVVSDTSSVCSSVLRITAGNNSNGSENDGDGGLRLVSQSPISSVSELFRTTNVSNTRACSPFQIVKNVRFGSTNSSGAGDSIDNRKNLQKNSNDKTNDTLVKNTFSSTSVVPRNANNNSNRNSDNNDSNSNSFLTVKEINKMINSPKQPSISDDNNIVKDKSRNNKGKKQNVKGLTKRKANKKSGSSTPKKNTRNKGSSPKKQSPKKKKTTTTKKTRRKSKIALNVDDSNNKMAIDDVDQQQQFKEEQEAIDWDNNEDTVDTSFSNYFHGFGGSPEYDYHSPSRVALRTVRQGNHAANLELDGANDYDHFDFEPFDNVNDYVFNDLL